jgi:hypothetical protein
MRTVVAVVVSETTLMGTSNRSFGGAEAGSNGLGPTAPNDTIGAVASATTTADDWSESAPSTTSNIGRIGAQPRSD